MASLINGLGGDAGFGENSLARNDDYYTSLIDLTSVFPNGISFFGHTWTGAYVNNNGNITFSSGLYSYTPAAIGADYDSAIIAPFWADVDTRSGVAAAATAGGTSTGSNLVYYDLDPATGTFTVTWDDVGYYSYHKEHLNAFQLQLVSTGNQNFDIVYRYEDISWTTGTASGGTDEGLGGYVARAGFSAGDGSNYYEFYFSGNENFMLNLENTTLAGSSEAGVWRFPVTAGSIIGIGLENANDTLAGTTGNDIMDGRSGDDILGGGEGDDVIAGGEGNDDLSGGAGDDQLITGDGSDVVDGGDGTDAIFYAGIRNTLDVSITVNYHYQISQANSLDDIVNVEYIQFDDGRMSISYAVEVRENQEEFARFYSALFGRTPDNDGLTYWVNDLVNGNTMSSAANSFTLGTEFQNLYGPSVSNTAFVTLLYQNILDRTPDQAGYDYWISEIVRTGNRGDMIVSFANSTEYIGATQEEIDTYLADVSLTGYILI
jgi:Ca2+-binding RTX toxin-like protein